MYAKINEPADILIYTNETGLILKEKSLIAFSITEKKILAVGNEAEHFLSSGQEDVRIISPLKQGMIADYMLSVQLFKTLIQRAANKKTFRKQGVVLCISKYANDVEKRALQDAIHQAGAKEIWMADIPVAQFLKDVPENFPGKFRKFPIIIGITKEEPERYISELLNHALIYADQEGISAKRVAELLDKQRDSYLISR